MRSIPRVRHLLLLAVLANTTTGCLDEVPVDDGDGHLTEEELAGDGVPEGSDDLIIESGIGVRGALTLWDDTDFSDTRQVRYSYDSNFGNDGFNDKASSVANRTDYFWKLYEDTDYHGKTICIRPHSFVSNLGKYQRDCCVLSKDWGDAVSSAKKMTTSRSSCAVSLIVGDRL